MKKVLLWLLAAAAGWSLIGCAGASAPQAQEQTQAAAEETTVGQTLPTVAQTLPSEAQTEPQVLEGSLFLKASSVTFSLVGESEDIYLGLIPRELVSWESEDPSVVSVENGVLTANGVGSTTIRASYADRQVECSAGCLAGTQEELDSLGFEILSKPRHLLPEVDLNTPCTYFDNAAIVGDSIAYMMMQCESRGDYLGNMLFLTRGGTSLNGFVRRAKNIYYQGAERNLEDAIAASGVERVYIMIGSNDIASPPQREVFMENWDTMLGRIREKSPDVEVVIISNIPRCASESESKGSTFLTYNSLIAEYNTKLRQFAAENDCLYLDLYYYIQDHNNAMPQEYNLDGYHLNDLGYNTWMQVLRYYAQYELEGGTLA